MGFKEWVLNGPEPWLDPNHPNANRKFSVTVTDPTRINLLMQPEFQKKVRSYGSMFVDDLLLRSLSLGLEDANCVLVRSRIPGETGVRVVIWMQSENLDYSPMASIRGGDGQGVYLTYGNPLSSTQPPPDMVS